MTETLRRTHVSDKGWARGNLGWGLLFGGGPCKIGAVGGVAAAAQVPLGAADVSVGCAGEWAGKRTGRSQGAGCRRELR